MITAKAKAKAKAMHDEIYVTDPRMRDTFTASRGWLETFMVRNGRSLGSRTTVDQHDPVQLIDRLISYDLHVRRSLKTFHYPFSQNFHGRGKRLE